jgi:D-alanine-D-alanine ligase-like ATP-grasp enzyme
VDLVLDRDQGAMVLEANARPGLAIQIANRHGLRRAAAGFSVPAAAPATYGG